MSKNIIPNGIQEKDIHDIWMGIAGLQTVKTDYSTVFDTDAGGRTLCSSD